MSKKREILRLLDLGLSQRAIASAARVSPNKVSEMRQFCTQRNLAYSEALKLSDEEIDGEKKKEERTCGARRPDCSYIHEELKKKGVTLKALHDEYVEQCVSLDQDYLKYTQFCNVYKEYVEDNKLTMHIERKPGERIEVDWSGGSVPIYDATGKEIIDKACLFVGVLPFSQYMYCEASLNMDSEAWINCHINMFRYFDGVATILQCDNLKTGVISHRKYEEVIYNRNYQEMCEYYDTAALAARVRAPKDKSSSEASVGYLTNQIIGKLRNYHFTSIFELNEKILEVLRELNARPFQKRDYSRTYVYENEEKSYLKKLPEKPFEYAVWKKAIVQYNYHVGFEHNYYSVPYTLLRKEVDLRISRYMIEIFHKNERIASHPRILSGKGKYVTMEEHMPENHRMYGQWNKERIIEWSKKIGNNTYRLICSIFDKARFEVQVYNQCITILKLADKYSKDTLESACGYILEKQISPIHKNFKMVIELLQSAKQNKTERKDDGAIIRGASYYGKKQ